MGTTLAYPLDLRRLRVRVGLAIVVGAVLWVAFAKLLVPLLLSAAYQASAPSILTHLVTGVGKPLDTLLARWSTLTQAGLWGLLLFGVIAWALTNPAFFRRCVGEATPGSLGAIRMLACSILFVLVLGEDLASTASFPREMIERLVRVEAAIHVAVMNFTDALAWGGYRLPDGARFVPPVEA